MNGFFALYFNSLNDLKISIKIHGIVLLCKYQKEKESSVMSFLDELNEISKTPEEAVAENIKMIINMV